MERKKLNFRKLRKFAKNAKALSPVIATIILIAVTVAVSVVVAAWMGGLTLGFMGGAESASITNVILTNTSTGTPIVYSGTAVCTVQNTGSSTVSITSGTIDGTAYAATGSINKGSSGPITITIAAGTPFSNSAEYTIKLMTAKGNTIVYTATYSGP